MGTDMNSDTGKVLFQIVVTCRNAVWLNSLMSNPLLDLGTGSGQ